MPFNLQQFQEHLGNVDKDYRLMALFDLMKSLKNAVPSAVHDAVVNSVMNTLSDTDGQVRNDAVSVFPLLVCACNNEQQNTLLKFLLKEAASQPSLFGTKNFSERADLCSMALKRSTTALADACQRNTAKWQAEVPVVAQFSQHIVSQLKASPSKSGRENVYASIVSLISLFANTWEESIIQQIAECAMKDFVACPNENRLTSTCIAKILPFADARTFEAVQKFTFAGIEQADENTLSAFLQLCTEAFNADSYRLRSSAPKLLGILLSRLGALADGAEDPHADNELLLVNTLLTTYHIHLSEKWNSVFDVCASISSLGISSDESDAYATDDYYEDYYGSSNDETWKLRREALRVIASLVTLSGAENFGARALSAAASAVCDSFEEVQIEAITVVRSVAKKPYATSPQIVNSLVEVCPSLLYFLHTQGKTFPLVLNCIELFFRRDNDALAFAPHVVKSVEDALSTTPNTTQWWVDLVRVACGVLESLLSSASSSIHKYARSLCLSLIECTTVSMHQKALQQCIGAAELFIAANREFPDAQIGEKVVAVYGAVCASQVPDLAARCSSLSAAGRWCCAGAEKKLIVQSLSVLRHGILHNDTTVAALKALSETASSEVCVKEIQSSIVTDVISALHTPNTSTRQAVYDCMTSLLRAGIQIPSDLSVKLLKSATENVHDCPCAVLYMSCAFCERNPDSASQLYENVISVAWQNTQPTPHDEYTFTPSPTTVALAAACAALSKTSETLRKTIGDRVIKCITESSSDMSNGCALVRGVVIADDAFTASFISEMQRACSQKRANWLLALGEAGRVMKISGSLSNALVESVSDASGERVRTCGKTALSMALTNAANSSLLTDCVSQALTPNSGGCVYLLKAVQSGARRAVDMKTSCFHDAQLCLPLIEKLLTHTPDENATDAIGGCVGSMVCFFPSEASKLLCSLAEEHRPSAGGEGNSIPTHALCASAARFILTSTDTTEVHMAVKPLVELLFADFTRNYDVSLRQYVVRLLTAVAHTYPKWLCCDAFKTVFPNLVIDLLPCSKLVGRLVLGNYTHCTDRGLDLRIQTFECVSAIFDADERKGTGVLAFVDSNAALLNALIDECGSNSFGASGGPAETDKSINDRAKRLLSRFFRLIPDTEPTEEQIAKLCNNLDVNLDVSSSGSKEAETRDASTVQSISLICDLEKCSVFTHNTTFRKLATKAIKSPLLADALALK